MKKKILLFLIILIPLIAYIIKSVSPSFAGKYGLVVGAGRGVILTRRVIYAVDEFGNSIKINLPEELGQDLEFSSSGQWMAYSNTNPDDNDYYIYLTRMNDNKTIPLINTKGAYAPTWSSSGSQIAFFAYNNDNRKFGIYLLNVDCTVRGEDCGSVPTFLTEGVNPDWSPKGDKIVFQRYGEGVFVVDIRNLSEATKIGDCGGSPQWSPDGTKIAFACDDAVYIVDPNGKHLLKIRVDATRLQWSPDGKKIAFIGSETLDSKLGKNLSLGEPILSTAIFMMDENGTNITRITKSNVESIGWFAWIPDITKQIP